MFVTAVASPISRSLQLRVLMSFFSVCYFVYIFRESANISLGSCSET